MTRTKAPKVEEPVAPKEKTYLVGFRCPDCGCTAMGYLTARDYSPRICNSPYGRDADGKRISLRADEKCAATMIRSYDGRTAS